MADNVSGKDVTAVTSEGADSPMAPSIFRGGVTVRLNKSTLKKRYMYRFFKRVFDIVFSGVVCLVALVPGAVLCVAIRLDSPGSPFFRQSRVGKDGREIRIFKFRSMYADAHGHPEKYLDEDQLTHWLREQKVDDDPRNTRIGHFLRSTSIDEVPQFLNVLLGDIPLRILKTRPEFSEKSMGAFALPAKSSTNKEKAFSQFMSCFANGLRMRRISLLNCNCIGGMETQFLAKPVYGVSPVHPGTLFQKSNNGLAKAAW